MHKIIIGVATVFLCLGLLLPVYAMEPLHDFDGKPKKLAEYTGQGKWLVVMIWAHDCHVCNEEAHEYVKFHDRNQSDNARVLGISVDGASLKKEAEKFISRHKLSFPNIIGEPDDVARIYMKLTGVESFGTPSFLVYNPRGELRAQQIGAVPANLLEAFMKKESRI